MKFRFASTLFLVIVLFARCASNSRQLTTKELSKVEILGSVEVNFTLMGTTMVNVDTLPEGHKHLAGYRPPSSSKVMDTAYSKLLAEAFQKYGGNIDVKNITVEENVSKRKRISENIGDEYYYTSTGIVIKTDTSSKTLNKLDDISNQIIKAFRGNKNTTIAILDFVNIDGKKSVLGQYLAEQISNSLFQNSNLKIVERAQINRIIDEHNFNMSGFVDNETAAKIGYMLGATAVTIGTLTKVGNEISVNIKIIETESSLLLSSGATQISGSEYVEMYNQIN